MNVEETALDGVLHITPTRHGDDRGWFSEVWNRATWAEAGIDMDFVQDNESTSAASGTVRGIHFQKAPYAQDKLVRVIKGRILDVAVDLRRSSATFGNYVAVELTADVGNQLLVPKGFGHGFATLEPDCHVAYKVSTPYDAQADTGISYADPDLAIDWRVNLDDAVVSDKDRNAPLLRDADSLIFD